MTRVDPDGPPPFDPRTVRRLTTAGLAVFGLGLALTVAAGLWAWHRTADRRRAEGLFQIVHPPGGSGGRRLTDPEFEEAIVLAASPDWLVRDRAGFAAARSCQPDKRELMDALAAGRPVPPDRGPRVEAVGLRLLDSADPRDQADGLKLLWLANRSGQLERVRPFLTATDPGVRRAAVGAAAHFDRVKEAGDAAR